MSFIDIDNLCFSYNDDDRGCVQVLRNVSLSVERGEMVAILGHNGSGKSTLAKLLNMILTPDSGRIVIDGTDITDPAVTENEDAVAEVRRKIGMVLQNPDNQLVATIVEEDVAFGPENLGVPSDEIRRRVDDALAAVGMTEYARSAPHQLSGGQKQRIAIAGILAMKPACIVFDESTAMLDPSGRAEVMKTMCRLNREDGITVIAITHNMNEAVLCSRVVVLDDGRVALDGTPSEVFREVEKLRGFGLDVPQVTELLYELRRSGYDLPRDVLDEETGADILAALLS